LQEKGQHESFNFHLYYYTWKKNDLFEESSDSDIRKLVGNVVSEITKKATKYEPESQR